MRCFRSLVAQRKRRVRKRAAAEGGRSVRSVVPEQEEGAGGKKHNGLRNQGDAAGGVAQNDAAVAAAARLRPDAAHVSSDSIISSSEEICKSQRLHKKAVPPFGRPTRHHHHARGYLQLELCRVRSIRDRKEDVLEELWTRQSLAGERRSLSDRLSSSCMSVAAVIKPHPVSAHARRSRQVYNLAKNGLLRSQAAVQAFLAVDRCTRLI